MNEEELLNFLSLHYRVRLESDTIREVKWDTIRFRPLGEISKNEEYDELSVKDFLIMYKISRLESLNIIDENKARQLRTHLLLKQLFNNQ